MSRRLRASVGFLLMSLALINPEGSFGKSSGIQSSDLNAVRGVVKPSEEAVISSELQARVKRMPFRDGQAFKKGNLLVEFDCEKYWAELAAAQAELEAREKTALNNQELAKLNGIGQLEVDVSESEVKQAKAAVRSANVAVRHCKITAPFSGRVAKTLVHPHESVNPYDEVMSVLNDKNFEIELILPSTSLRWVTQNSPFKFFIDETQELYEAVVLEIGARVDPVSQTIRVFGEFKEQPQDVLAGMSGSARFMDRKLKSKTPKPTFKPSTSPSPSTASATMNSSRP
ncbi:MAG: efflux RND transporter periplasmic adaptor subunit [Nitrospirota bacterium]|nr:efflux RND transporter periplasmic adaptor subunit [Nitrospirota bacterium]